MLAAANGSTTVTVNLVDQLGNPIPSTFATGFDVVTLNIVGRGSFIPAGTAATTSETVYVAAGLPWTATVSLRNHRGVRQRHLLTKTSGLER